MFKKTSSIILLVILTALILSACNLPFYKVIEDPIVGMPNPASVYCEDQGGSLEIRDNTMGVCMFEDGSECEEWAYYRGECKPGDMDVFTTPSPTPTTMPVAPIETTAPNPNPELSWLPVVGPEPSYRVAAFYYPWYRTPDVDTYWDHWGEGTFHPPLDIASDFYPALGAYSIADPAILAQHFAWLREAGIGVIIS
ncbi:MAG: DUF333 domain-containing protein, partial [Anaerolineaceae bacterium]|nr:DUF333 domain-containing protein [Anaerolineaceae bacterium]